MDGIYKRDFSTADEAAKWLQLSFLAVRINKNPAIYGISDKSANADAASLCKDIACGEFYRLCQAGMLTFADQVYNTTVETVQHKVLVLIQYGLQCRPLPSTKYSSGLAQDMGRALRLAWSPAICIRDAYASRGDTDGVVASTVLCREIAAQCAENTPALLQQIDGIGQRYTETLWEKGVQSITQLCEKNAREIEHVLYQLEMDMEWIDETSVIFTIRISYGRNKVGTDTQIKSTPFTVVAYTSDGLLLKFEAFELSSDSAYYEAQVGLCNPILGSTAVLEVAPERHVGCSQRLTMSISARSSENSCTLLPTTSTKAMTAENDRSKDDPSSDLPDGLVLDEGNEIANLLQLEDFVDCDVG
ncbi:hypothetical protein H4R20_002280 [Coemansia guatemalensis]|uniref:SEC63 domain-containing protein n=1 Tax=Coemansia guatemalensis TaxID=2761395 RepID=A0A9W8HXY1_9FUNG|nr:hypothetical protein H4R20_002280 [Coemansia guatemalensis]